MKSLEGHHAVWQQRPFFGRKAPTMTSVAPQSSVVFNNAVARFRDSLTEDEKTKIRTTTMKDVELEINKIQIDQGSAKRLHNMSRLTRFVEAMSQIEKIVTVFLNASEVVAFIWVGQSLYQNFRSRHNLNVEAGNRVLSNSCLLLLHLTLKPSTVSWTHMTRSGESSRSSSSMKACSNTVGKVWKSLNCTFATFCSSIQQPCRFSDAKVPTSLQTPSLSVKHFRESGQ